MNIDFLFGKYIQKVFNNSRIFLRKNSVDLEVYDYVFEKKYHRPYKEIVAERPLILDLGANIGLTIVDFKTLYPKSVIYAYELDEDNYKLAIKNCKQFSDCNIYNLAIWSESTKIKYNKKANVDAYKVNLSSEDEKNFTKGDSITINEIILQHQIVEIEYLKMDIEGAEYEIFLHNLDWLDITKQIKIEIHDGSEIMEFIWEKLAERGFSVVKDTNHWSTIIGFRE